MYKTPQIDKVLLDAGWVRCNEAPVYLVKYNNGIVDRYSIFFPIEMIGWTSMEKWFEAADGEDAKNRIKEVILNSIKSYGFMAHFNNTNPFEAILMHTAEFYYNNRDWDTYQDWKKRYETFTKKPLR